MTILLSGVGNDIHCVALRLIEIEFAQRAVNCCNIGAANSFKFIRNRIYEIEPKVVLLSSTNGELYEWKNELKLLVENFKEIPILLGGNLMVGDYDDKAIEQEFIALGCAVVFSRRGTIPEICDLAERFASCL